MADVHGDPRDAPQMPQADYAGSAPVPYHGPDLQPEPPDYSVDLGPMADPAGHVMGTVPASVLGTTQAGYAHDARGGDHDAPYDPGNLSAIDAIGDSDAGGRDDVSASVQAAVDNATGRWREFTGDNGTTGTPGAGAEPVHAGVIGDLMQFPPSPLDPGAGVGNTTPTGGFYDPPRGYGADETAYGPEGAPGYGLGGGQQGLPPRGYQGKAI